MVSERTGILQLGETRVAVELLTIDSRFGYPDEITLRVTPDVFEVSNKWAKTNPYLKLKIKEVIFNDPATIVIWSDGTKTVVKCQPNDVYSKETGLAMCIAKKFLGNKGNFNKVFKKFIEDYDPREK
jgi:hypothetical protein